MINAASARAVDGSRWQTRFVKPLYDTYCFAQIPALIESLFGPTDTPVGRLLLGPLAHSYDKVILLFIDAFGWRFVERYADQYPFLNRMMRDGMATRLTSQFPSTTAAHTTTIHTGLPVGRHGVYEWFCYEPLVDAVIAPLPFSFAGDQERNTLSKAGVDPKLIFPQSTLYQLLHRQGVKSFLFQSRDFTPSPFSDAACSGANILPFASLYDGLGDLVASFQAERERSYHFLYFGGIDAAGHHHGPNSAQFTAEVDSCFRLLESVLHRGLQENHGRSLLLLTADHGQVEANPSETIYLNKTIPESVAWMQTDGLGRPRWPTGYCRDMFLHIAEEHLDEAHNRLRDHISGRADVVLVGDLIDGGFFGSGPPSDTFLSRVGNVLVLPYEGELVWWYDPRYYTPKFWGHHGGLTPGEMETQLLAFPYE